MIALLKCICSHSVSLGKYTSLPPSFGMASEYGLCVSPKDGETKKVGGWAL